MNLHPVLVLLLLGHILGDFYFQSGTMAANKNTSSKWLAAHALAYTGSMAVVLFGCVAYARELIWLFLAAAASHLLIDIGKRFVTWSRIFTIDQLAHLAVLTTAWKIWGEALTERSFVAYAFPNLPKSFILIVLGLLVILRPVGTLIAQGDIWDFSKGGSSPTDSQRGSGRMIGYLERIVVFFLLMYGQYGAIAFVITAKSVARFPEIGEGRALAEYYLIGTLLSMTSVFAVTLLLGLTK